MINLSRRQVEAFHKLNEAVSTATDSALFDKLAEYVHPDIINQFVDALDNMNDDRNVQK